MNLDHNIWWICLGYPWWILSHLRLQCANLMVKFKLFKNASFIGCCCVRQASGKLFKKRELYHPWFISKLLFWFFGIECKTLILDFRKGILDLSILILKCQTQPSSSLMRSINQFKLKTLILTYNRISDS